MRYPIGIAVLFALTACVSKGRLELVEVQLDATRTAMSARQAAAFEQRQVLETRIAELEAALQASHLEVDELDGALRALRTELSVLRQQRVALALAVPPIGPDAEVDTVPPPVLQDRQAALDELDAALSLALDRRLARAAADVDHQAVTAAFEEVTGEGWAEVLRDGNASVVRLGWHVLFQEGRVGPSPRGEMVMQRVAAALRRLPGTALQIEAHTDDRPYNSVQHPSSWELGFAHAALVLRMLEEEGVPMVPSATSFAGTRPRIDEDNAEARRANRRIELVLTTLPPVEAEKLQP